MFSLGWMKENPNYFKPIPAFVIFHLHLLDTVELLINYARIESLFQRVTSQMSQGSNQRNPRHDSDRIAELNPSASSCNLNIDSLFNIAFE